MTMCVTDSGEFQTNDIHEIITSHSGLLYILYVGRIIFNVSLFKVMNLMYRLGTHSISRKPVVILKMDISFSRIIPRFHLS